jgi:transcriptional regulator with XRE-family HTH domain
MVKPKELPPNRIRELREARGMSRAALAERAETAAAQIQKLELGLRQLTHTWMLKLAPALGCNPADLLPESDKYGLPNRENAVATKLLAGAITALLDGKLPIDLLTERLKQFGLPTATIDLASNVLLHIGKRTEQTNDRNELIEIVTATLVASAAAQPAAGVQTSLGQIDTDTLLSRLIDSTDDILSRHFGFDVETKERFRTIANTLATDGVVTFDSIGRALIKLPNENAPKQIVPFLGIPGSPSFYVPRSRREYISWNSKAFVLIEPVGPNAFVIELAKDSGTGQLRRGEKIIVDPDVVPSKYDEIVLFERIHSQDPEDIYFLAQIDHDDRPQPHDEAWDYSYVTYNSDGTICAELRQRRSRLFCVGVVRYKLPTPSIDV